MITGVGCDLVRTARFARPLTNAHFVERIFTARERTLLDGTAQKERFAAGRWAGKEAFVKALGCGFAGCEPGEIGIVPDEQGAPRLQLHGRAAELLGKRRAHISLSHDGEYALAFVVLEDI